MGLRVTFELNDNDLRHFRLIMREARKAAANASPEDIVASAEDLLKDIGTSGIPKFVTDRLENLEIMIRMLSDHEWALPEQESARVLNALAYFCEPEDLIPDHRSRPSTFQVPRSTNLESPTSSRQPVHINEGGPSVIRSDLCHPLGMRRW